MNISLVKIQALSQVLLNKQNLIILHWVKFLKGLDKEDKKKGFFKRLKNIEDKNEERLKAIEDQEKNPIRRN